MPRPARADAPATTRWRTSAATRRAALVAACAVALAAAGAVGVGLRRPAQPPPSGRTILVDIPVGAAARLARGERIAVVARSIVGRVGDRLRLVNHDVVTHTVGPFMVAPGQRLSIPLRRPGVFTGACSLHRSHRVRIVVRA